MAKETSTPIIKGSAEALGSIRHLYVVIHRINLTWTVLPILGLTPAQVEAYITPQQYQEIYIVEINIPAPKKS